MPRAEERPGDFPHIPPRRRPIYGFGDTLRRNDFVGRVDVIYADYWAALDACAVPSGWFERQRKNRPSSKDQVFYGLVALDGSAAILVGEADVKPDRMRGHL